MQADDPAASLKRLGDLLEAMVAAEARPAADAVIEVVDDPLIHDFLVSPGIALQDFEAACLALTAGDRARRWPPCAARSTRGRAKPAFWA